jgi:mono/diheme cytochrome c family protein/tRNA A-37 threonylcarbamoyl transferase component Bud32
MSGNSPTELGETLASPPATLVGQRVGNFTVESLIGKGAMGAVYLGVHETLNRRVAIKVLQPELAANESLVQRFIDEARAASQLGHPGLIQVSDFGALPDGRRYSVMELLDGRDLETALRQDGPQQPGRVAAIGLQVASALQAAHAKGIVHRDLKPANLFLARDHDGHERMKVLDFGIAKLLAGESGGRTAAGHIVGTPEYMAPEQAQAHRDIDHRVDIYSLGCVLYELLTGQPPHVGDSVPAILVAQLQEPAQPPSERTGGVPPALEAIIMRCLEKDRGRRFASMAELGEALEPLAESLPPARASAAPLPPATQPGYASPGRRRGRTLLVGLGVAAITAAGVTAFLALEGHVDRALDSTGDAAGAGAKDAAMWGDTTAVGTDENPYSIDDERALAAGAAIWGAKCARCHGREGEGDGPEAEEGKAPRAFSEMSGNSASTDVYRFTVTRFGAESDGMPGFAGELTSADMWKVVTFIRTLSAGADESELALEAEQPPTTPALIARGKRLFRAECRSCHGAAGKGNGRAAKYLGRLPADLTAGVYKLRSTPKSSIPTDWDIYRTVSAGIGTGIMPGFPRLPPEDRWALVAYVKTLSPRFRREKPADVLEVPERIPSSPESLARGMALFRQSGCPTCHGASGHGDGPRAGTHHDRRGNKVRPPDFSDRFALLSGSRPEDIYRTLWNGIAGVPMPMGQTVLGEEDAWHVINWILSRQK